MIIFFIAVTTIGIAYYAIPELFSFNEDSYNVDLTWDRNYIYTPNPANKNKKVTFNNKVTVYKYNS